MTHALPENEDRRLDLKLKFGRRERARVLMFPQIADQPGVRAGVFARAPRAVEADTGSAGNRQHRCPCDRPAARTHGRALRSFVEVRSVMMCLDLRTSDVVNDGRSAVVDAESKSTRNNMAMRGVLSAIACSMKR